MKQHQIILQRNKINLKIQNIKVNKNGKYVVTIDNEKYNLYQDTMKLKIEMGD